MPDQSTDDLQEFRGSPIYYFVTALLARAEAAEANARNLKTVIEEDTQTIEELAAERDRLQHDLDATLEMMAGGETPPSGVAVDPGRES